MRRWQLGALSWLVTLVVGSAVAAEPERGITVKYEGDGLSVEATNVTLPDLLRAVGNQVGFTVVDKGGPRSAIPRFSFHGARVEGLLNTLLVNENSIISYHLSPGRPGDHVVAEVILLGRSLRDAREGPLETSEAARKWYEGAAEQARVLMQRWQDSLKGQAGEVTPAHAEPLKAVRERYEGAAEQARTLLQEWENSMKERRLR